LFLLKPADRFALDVIPALVPLDEKSPNKQQNAKADGRAKIKSNGTGIKIKLVK
jgi:hypothetical protein